MQLENEPLQVEPRQPELQNQDADTGLMTVAEANYNPRQSLGELEMGNEETNRDLDAASALKRSHSSASSKGNTTRPNDHHARIASFRASNPLLDEALHLSDHVRSVCRHLTAKRRKSEAEVYASRLQIEEFKTNQSTHFSTIAYLQQQLAHQTSEAQTARRHVETLTNELRELRQIHSSTTQLLAERSKELTVAQQFLTTADSMAGADVIRLVERLNGEIFQCAAYLADTLPPRIRKVVQTKMGTKKPSSSENIARDWIGEPVIQLLRGARGVEDPSAAVQIAVQTCLVSYCAHFVNSWHHDPHIGNTFRHLYSTLRQTTVTPIASRWRTLTKSNLNRLHGRSLSSDAINSMFTRLSEVVAVAGYLDGLSPSSEALSSNLNTLAESLMELKSVVGEKALFSDMEPFFYSSGIPFDANSMEDTFGDSRQSNAPNVSHEPILCTTDLGLRESMVVQGEDMRYTEDRSHILLMPKVVLQSTVGEILGQV